MMVLINPPEHQMGRRGKKATLKWNTQFTRSKIRQLFDAAKCETITQIEIDEHGITARIEQKKS